MLVAGCSSSVYVTTQSDPAADFSRYHAFVWGSPPDTSGEKSAEKGANKGSETAMTLKPETDKIIRQALVDGLKSRGITPASDPTASIPTLVVGYTVLVKREAVTRPRVSATDRHTGKDLSDEYSFDVGTLLVEFADKGTGRKVWWGAAQADLKPGSTQAQAQDAVERLMAKYPK
jgi:hypothetical protein